VTLGDHPFQARYACLDDLPRRLFRQTVTHIHGSIIPRGEAILCLRRALLSGRVPPAEALGWPEPLLRESLVEALLASNVAPYCNADTEITDDILLFVLQVIHDAHWTFDRGLVAFHARARKDRARWISSRQGCGTELGLPAAAFIDDAECDAIRREATSLACELIRARTECEWGLRVEILAQLAPIFDELAAGVNLPPGCGRGMLRAVARNRLLDLRQLMADVPAVKELICTLGRLREAVDESSSSVLERIGEAVRRTVVREREVESPRGPEVRGIERSGEISRMLASEAALLAQPVMRRLWRARWAERALVTYQAPGVYTQRIQDRQTFEDGERLRNQRAEQGPVIAVVDTSGSMIGTRDMVAKAIVIQLVGTAFLEQRACYVYNFSSPGELVEQELSFGSDGLAAMLGFISMSFYGGTEIDEAMRRACNRIRQREWRQADVVVISDGYLEPEPHTRKLVRSTLHESNARLHGIALGGGGGFALLGCDSIHRVSRWVPLGLDGN
jgi:Mg-chelatase subunit ChlD